MPIVLSRVDDRLVHGQVVIGWGRPLAIDRIVLVDAEVAASPFEQDLYRMAVPAGTTVEFLEPGTAAVRASGWAAGKERVLVLTGSVATMIALQRLIPSLLRQINLGGIHDAPGRRELARYVYLTEDEIAALRALDAQGVEITAQDLPTARPIPLTALVRS
jgi:PTS system mannose-specific IIB component/fructoselysine and glucoselysine-specific PTS system IIB component